MTGESILIVGADADPPVRLRRISRLPSGASDAVPVVFVHGAWHGAWCWDANFLPYFAHHGHPAYAFDLRGHGGSQGTGPLRRTRIDDYVCDLEQVVAGFATSPVLVGHSMGGLIVQRYLEAHPGAGGVLLASLPPGGSQSVALRLAARHPITMMKVLTTRSLLPLVATPQRAREAFFSPGIDDRRLADYFAQLQDESYRAFLDVALHRVRPRPIRAPMLVVGAQHDTFLSHADVRATARVFHTTATFFPAAHDLMLEDGWQNVADHILRWLDQRRAPAHRLDE